MLENNENNNENIVEDKEMEVETEKKGSLLDTLIHEWVIPILAAVVIFLFINNFVFFNVQVPTSSMEPTIIPGDRLLVTVVYNPMNLERGDVVVFESEELGEKLIKRLIGLPGETVEISSNGDIFIDGELLDESEYILYQVNGMTEPFNPGVYEVPEDSFFFVGDNRANSKDARYWEEVFISEDAILGKAQWTIYPFSNFGELK